jgi:hypothetical protein
MSADIDAFLSSDVPPVGGKCQTCRQPEAQRAEWEEAVGKFLVARDARTTTWNWQGFFKAYLVSKLNYPHSRQALERHMEKCVGRRVQEA